MSWSTQKQVTAAVQRRRLYESVNVVAGKADVAEICNDMDGDGYDFVLGFPNGISGMTTLLFKLRDS